MFQKLFLVPEDKFTFLMLVPWVWSAETFLFFLQRGTKAQLTFLVDLSFSLQNNLYIIQWKVKFMLVITSFDWYSVQFFSFVAAVEGFKAFLAEAYFLKAFVA